MMAQDMLSMKLTDFSSDPSTLTAPGDLMMVPDVLEYLYRGELDLFEKMKNDRWIETMDTIEAMSAIAAMSDGSFLVASKSFKEKAEEDKKNWNDAVTVYLNQRNQKRQWYYRNKIENAQKRCDELNIQFERERKEWQRKNEMYV